MVRAVRRGEPFDVLVAAPDQIDALVSDGLIIPETRTALARSGIGVAVRTGAAIPDVSSVDAFKRTLLSAKSIAYLKEGQSGVYLARLLEDLSIAAAIERKVVRLDKGIVTLAGPLPDEIQNYVVFSAGVSARSRNVRAATDFARCSGRPFGSCGYAIARYGAGVGR